MRVTMDEQKHPSTAEALGDLKAKAKQPNSANTLNAWIAQAESRLGQGFGGGRLGWLIASSIAIAAVQRAVDDDGRQLFLLKGGTLLQHRLGLGTRATKDIDGIVRGDIDDFFLILERALAQPWGPIALRRGPIEVVDVPTRVLKPRRFDIFLELRGVTWRRVQFEISPDEAGIGAEGEPFQSPSLVGFGLPDPDHLVGITLRHQIAQKFHAVTDPHDPPASINDRARDVVDLLLLRDLVNSTGVPSDHEIADAVQAVFRARAREASQLGYEPRRWPTPVVSHPHWARDYDRAASSAGLDVPLDEAVAQVNAWAARLRADPR